MKISILTPDLSGNCVGRAWVLGKMLSAEHEVEIIGPATRNRLWKPLESEKAMRFVPVESCAPITRFKEQVDLIRRAITGDLVYVSKPLLTNVLPAVLEKRDNGLPYLVDIDDWQMGFELQKLRSPTLPLHLFYRDIVGFNLTTSFWNNLVGNLFLGKASGITVSNSFLNRKFGGVIIPHGRDGDFLDPSRFSGSEFRARLNLDQNTRVVSFIGSPRPHKGIEDLIAATARLEDVVLMVVGLGDDRYSEIVRALGRKKMGVRFIGLKGCPLDDLPKYLAMSDVVAIPQRAGSATVGQTPAKVFDAMAMGRPLVVTRIGDLPDIVADCGLIAEPGNIKDLGEKIDFLIANPEKAALLGRAARERFLSDYDLRVLRERLQKLISSIAWK